jgi:hypothetical protein
MASYLRSMLPLCCGRRRCRPALDRVAGFGGRILPVAGEAAGANAANTLPDLRQPHAATRATSHASRDRYVRPTRNDLDCSGPWCRRHFVLMIGIAY